MQRLFLNSCWKKLPIPLKWFSCAQGLNLAHCREWKCHFSYTGRSKVESKVTASAIEEVIAFTRK